MVVVVVAKEGEGHVHGRVVVGRRRRGPLRGGAGDEKLVGGGRARGRVGVVGGGVEGGGVEGDEPAAARGMEVAGGGGDTAPAGGVEVDVVAVADVLLVEAVEGDGLVAVGAPEQGEEGGGKLVRVAGDEGGGGGGAGGAGLVAGELFAEVAHVHVRLDVAAEAVLVETLAGAHLAVEAGLLQAAAAALLLLVLVLGVADAHAGGGDGGDGGGDGGGGEAGAGAGAVAAGASVFMSPRAAFCARTLSRPGQQHGGERKATPPQGRRAILRCQHVLYHAYVLARRHSRLQQHSASQPAHRRWYVEHSTPSPPRPPRILTRRRQTRTQASPTSGP